MLFKDRLYKIYKDIEVRGCTRQDSYERIVSDRLNKSLNTYMDSLGSSVRHIELADSVRTLKRLSKDKV